MSVSERLLPKSANNDYQGGAVPLYTFCALATIMLGRSMIHFVKDDSGVNSIASIVLFAGQPDPNQVIYMFSSLWGSQQLLMVLLYAVVLWRYRNLIPLMFVVFMLESLFRLAVGTMHPLDASHFAHRPPGAYINFPLIAISGLMLFLSLRRPASKDPLPQ